MIDSVVAAHASTRSIASFQYGIQSPALHPGRAAIYF